jgi:hypothetical protein
MTATAAVDHDASLSITQTEAIRQKLTAGEVSVLGLVRGFGVTVGPSIVLDVVAGASVASALRALARRRHPSRPAALGTGLLAAYLAAVRPWMLRWGATPEERRKALPGDAMVPKAGSQCTRAVTVEAPVGAVWPWLAQLGQDRAGFNSYEWLENLAGCRMRNAEDLHAEWQERAIGDTVYLHHLYGLPGDRRGRVSSAREATSRAPGRVSHDPALPSPRRGSVSVWLSGGQGNTLLVG